LVYGHGYPYVRGMSAKKITELLAALKPLFYRPRDNRTACHIATVYLFSLEL